MWKRESWESKLIRGVRRISNDSFATGKDFCEMKRWEKLGINRGSKVSKLVLPRERNESPFLNRIVTRDTTSYTIRITDGNENWLNESILHEKKLIVKAAVQKLAESRIFRRLSFRCFLRNKILDENGKIGIEIF